MASTEVPASAILARAFGTIGVLAGRACTPVNFSFEGLMGLAGTVLIATTFPILLFGDYFDPEKKPDKLGLAAAFMTGFGLVCIAIPFLVVATRALWSAIAGL